MCLKFTNHYLSEPNKNNQIPYIMEQFALIRDMYLFATRYRLLALRVAKLPLYFNQYLFSEDLCDYIPDISTKTMQGRNSSRCICTGSRNTTPQQKH